MVSVIIPTKNEEHHITNYYESIKKQTYPQDKIETTAVDDNSTDSTKKIVKRYTDKINERLEVISDEK